MLAKVPVFRLQRCPACRAGNYDYDPPRLCYDCRRMPADIVLGMRWDCFVHQWRMIGFEYDGHVTRTGQRLETVQ
jgi:hypothetical protein